MQASKAWQALLVLLIGVGFTLKVCACSYRGPTTMTASEQHTPAVWTDKEDYTPGETVRIHGSGFASNARLTIRVTRPDGSVVTGDGSFAPWPTAYDDVEADETGAFTYDYILNGIEGEYSIGVLDGNGNTLATCTFTDSRTVLSATTITHGGDTAPPGTITVPPGATVSAAVHVSTDWWWYGDDDWKSTSWRIGSSGGYTCVNTGNHTSSGTYSETFDITAPMAPGLYNVSFRAYSNNTCSSGQSSTFTLTDAINVSQPAGIHIDKTSLESTVEVGETIHYSYEVTNETGRGALSNINVTDDRCPFPTGPIKTGGDLDDLLEDFEVWTYTCDYIASESDGSSVTNTATAEGTPPTGGVVDDTDTLTVGVTPPSPDINPTLSETCGLDMVLVLDSSDSLTTTELQQVRNAAHDFVDAFLPATPTLIGVVDFDTQIIGTSLDLTDSKTAIDAAIDGIGHTGATELTNWDAALTKARGILTGINDRNDAEHPDLIVLVTDGDPTTYGYPTSQGSYGGTEPDAVDINRATLAANAAKAQGIRVVALGVGGAPTVANLSLVSGPVVSPPATISSTTDAITSGFSALAGILANLASELCGGTITVHKVIDADGNLGTTGDQTASGNDVAGWVFSLSVSGGSSTPSSGSTDTSGSTVPFDIAITGSTATISIVETVEPGYNSFAASCSGATSNGTYVGATSSVDGIAVTSREIVACTFYNTPQVAGISITKTVTDVGGGGAGGSVDNAGDLISYEVVVTNTGNVAITGTLADTLTTSVGSYTESATPADDVLSPGETWTWTYSYEATQDDIDTDGGGDGFIDNEATFTPSTGSSQSANARVPVGGTAGFTIEKTVTDVGGDGDSGSVDEPGDVISYQVVVTNTGTLTLTGTLTDTLVDPVGPYTESETPDDDLLSPGETWTWTYSYQATQDDFNDYGGGDGDIDNEATFTPSSGSTQSDSKAVPIVRQGGISIIKVSDPQEDTNFEFNGAFGQFFLDDASPDDLDGVPNRHDETTLRPNVYQIWEIVPDGWICTVSIATSDPSDTSSTRFDPSNDRMYAELDLDEGESIVVTFTNTKQFCSLTVYKETTPDGGSDFEFTDDVEDPFSFVLGDGQSKTFSEIAPGQYTIIESNLPGTTPPATPWVIEAIESTGDGLVSFGDGATVHSTFQTGDDRVIITLANRDEGSIIFRNRSGQRPPGGGGGSGGGGSASYNMNPLPNAGPDRLVCVGEYVCLDASASHDPDGGFQPFAEAQPEQAQEVPPLEYAWAFSVWYYRNGRPVLHVPEASQAATTLEGTDTAFPCFVPDVPGDYVLLLTVTDEYGAAAVDEITLRAKECSETYSCPYPEGWNLFSLPAQPVDARAESVLEDTSADSPAYSYDNGYYETVGIGPTGGYWVHFLSPDTVTVLGRLIQDDITLRLEEPGWHLISSPFSIPWDRVLVFVNGAERFIGEEIAREAIDTTCVCYDPTVDVYRMSAEILPCQGYWVRTRAQDVVLKFEWTAASQAAPPAQGGCTSGRATTIAPLPPTTSQSSQVSAVAYPNPVRHSTVHFELRGLIRSQEIRVEIYDLSGKPVWQGAGDGNRLDWVPRAADGGRLPWGPYIYCTYGLVSGEWRRADCAILFLAEED